MVHHKEGKQGHTPYGMPHEAHTWVVAHEVKKEHQHQDIYRDLQTTLELRLALAGVGAGAGVHGFCGLFVVVDVDFGDVDAVVVDPIEEIAFKLTAARVGVLKALADVGSWH